MAAPVHISVNYTSQFDVPDPNRTYIIDPGIVVTDSSQEAINCGVNGVVLVNRGVVFSNSSVAAYLTTSNSVFDNRAGASLVGYGDGIETGSSGEGLRVENRGLISGINDDGLDLYRQVTNGVVNNYEGGIIRGGMAALRFEGNGLTLQNRGLMDSPYVGIWIESDAQGAMTLNNYGQIRGGIVAVYNTSSLHNLVINNHGRIASYDLAVQIETAPGRTTVVHNFAGAVITSGDDSFYSTTAGRLSLDNRGTVKGHISLYQDNGSGFDKIVNHGKIVGAIYLGPGADQFVGTGGTSGRVSGAEGADTLRGGSARDTLDGGPGRDVLTGGGATRDIFDFNHWTETGNTAATRDRITDFQHGVDKIDLRTIDANGTDPGEGIFAFVAAKGHAFTGVKGQLVWSQQNPAGTAHDITLIRGDMDGNKISDFQIQLNGLVPLTGADFFL